MAVLKDQQDAIALLRTKRDQAADELYGAQLRLREARARLDRALRQETLLPKDGQKIAVLRSEIDTLRQELRGFDAGAARYTAVADQQQQLADNRVFLQKKREAIRGQHDELSRQLDAEEAAGTPDTETINGLQGRLDSLRRLEAEVDAALKALAKESGRIDRDLQDARTAQAERAARRDKLQAGISKRQAALAAMLQSGGNEDLAALRKQVDELTAKLKELRARAQQASAELAAAISKIYLLPHPKNAITQLSDGTPFLLLPVRIETRFMTVGLNTELWVRVYPDDIAVHTHEKLLTASELGEGVTYWKALFEAGKAGGTAGEELRKAAWAGLALAFGAERAAWIVIQTKPLNWSDDLSGIPGAEALAFPQPELAKPDSWSRAPRVNVLPDRFVITLYEGTVVAKEVVGNLIPDELFVGPDPLDPDAAFTTKDTKLGFGETFDWTSDFNKAVAVGMGFKIPLTATQAANGFTRIIAFGVNLSDSAATGQKMVEELVDNHRYSPKGFSLVPQGTATNNTEDNGSGYTKNEAPERSYVTGTGAPLFTSADSCDGKSLADALGIAYETLQHVHHSDGTDLKEAIAMNRALYASTLGYYFDTMLKPVLPEAEQDRLREFFVENVTGRGPVPAIRVGDQPYGILLTSNFEAWKPSAKGEAPPGVTFLSRLYAVLKHYNGVWKARLPQLAYVGKPGSDVSSVLMNVIGLQPGSASIYNRIGYSTDYLKNLDSFQWGGKYQSSLSGSITSKTAVLGFLQGFGYTVDANGQLKVPQLLRLIFQNYHTTLDAANIVDNVPLSETDPIRPFDKVANKNYLHWLAEISSLDTLEKQSFGTGIQPPTAIMYMQLRRSLSLQLHKASALWLRARSMNVDFTVGPNNFSNIRAAGDLSKWEVMRGKIEAVDPTHPQRKQAIGEYLLRMDNDAGEAAFLRSVKSSLAFLANLPTARLERCFMEHLDSCSYRLDAWQTALFNHRLKTLRQLHYPGRMDRLQGSYLGSYGWVENVRPSGKRKAVKDAVPQQLQPRNGRPLVEYTDNGGYVHAPSLNQASAAAVLRSGYMTHATPANPEVMAVNLSSDRVRRAIFILDGMRNGQSLEALLGYQFERGLHDRGSADAALKKLNAFIYDFRAAHPMQYHQIRQQGTEGPQESIPANNVVNGVTLASHSGAFPFGATGAVLGATADQKAAIIAEKDRLADTLDAVKDLLTAESVYQLVQGNFERAGALANAIQDAQIPDHVDIIDTPRGSHFSITNRVVLNFGHHDPMDPAGNPWPEAAMTPRALMEPGINRWLGTVLGDPKNTAYSVCYLDGDGNPLAKVTRTLTSLGIQPIDLIYITGNELDTGAGGQSAASELESRIAYEYRRSQGLDDDTPVKIGFTEVGAAPGARSLAQLLPLLRMLRLLLTDSRYLHAEDFEPHSKTSLADKTNPKSLDAAELLGRVQVAEVAFQAAMDAITGLAISAEIPDPAADNLVTSYNTLGAAFAALDAAHMQFGELSFMFGHAEAAQLQGLLCTVADFGIADAFPKLATVLDMAGKASLLEQARGIVRRMATVSQAVSAILAAPIPATEPETRVREYIRAGKLILQEAFNILPLFSFNNDADIQLAQSDTDQLLQFARTDSKMTYPEDEWMQNAAHVRPRVARWEGVRSLYELQSTGELALQAMQVPYRAGDSWLAVEYPKTDSLTGTPFNILHDTLSIVTHGEPFGAGAKHAGILVDDWTEMMPAQEETTGIAFNYNQPNAAPPQALLLAVPAEIKGNWTWDDLMGILNDTLNRAKLRAVEPQMLDQVAQPEVNVLRPAVIADFTQYDLNISLDYRRNLDTLAKDLEIKPIAK